MPGEPTALSARLARMLALDPDAPVIEFRGTWRTWGQLATTAEGVRGHVPGPGTRVGVLLRNSPAHIGLLVGLLLAGARVVTINPGRGEDRVRADVVGLGPPILAGSPADLAAFAPQDPDATALLLLAATDLGEPVTVHGKPPPPKPPSLPPLAGRPDSAAGRGGVAIEMLTSGTTGPPKRVPLSYQMLTRVLLGAKYYEGNADQTPRLRSGAAIVNAPLVHLGGLFRVLQCLNDGRPFCLL